MRKSIIYLFIIFNSLSIVDASTTSIIKQGAEKQDVKCKKVLTLSEAVCSNILYFIIQGKSRWRIRLNLEKEKFEQGDITFSKEICEIFTKLQQPLHVSNIIRLLTQPLSDKNDLLALAILKMIMGDIDEHLKLYTNTQQSVLIAFDYLGDDDKAVVRVFIVKQDEDSLFFTIDMLTSQAEHLLLQNWRRNISNNLN